MADPLRAIGLGHPDADHPGIATDHVARRLEVIGRQILFVAPHARVRQEGTGLHRILGAFPMRRRLRDVAVDRAHRPDGERLVDTERLATNPAELAIDGLRELPGTDHTEIGLSVDPRDPLADTGRRLNAVSAI